MRSLRGSSLDDLYKQIQEGEVKELNVIIKADVQGSAEAMKGSLEKIDVEGARIKIIHPVSGPSLNRTSFWLPPPMPLMIGI